MHSWKPQKGKIGTNKKILNENEQQKMYQNWCNIFLSGCFYFMFGASCASENVIKNLLFCIVKRELLFR